MISDKPASHGSTPHRCHVTAAVIFRRSATVDNSQRLLRMNALIELLLQAPFGLRGKSTFFRLLAGKRRQDRQFVFHVVGRDAIPKSVLKFEHVELVLFDSENLRMWKLHDNFIWPHIDSEILRESKTAFAAEGDGN